MSDLTRNDIAERIREAGVIAIVRLSDSAQLADVAEAIQAGGLDIIEFTMTTPGALDMIEHVATNSDGIVIGAGTVLDAETAREAIGRGAEFIVSPGTDPRVVSAAHEHDKAAMPGAYTPTEIIRAMELHADFVKLFPAMTLGPGYLRAVRAPLPNAPIVPTGGVNFENAKAFFEAGAEAIAIGSELVNNRLVEAGDFEAITQNARRFARIVKEVRGE